MAHHRTPRGEDVRQGPVGQQDHDGEVSYGMYEFVVCVIMCVGGKVEKGASWWLHIRMQNHV